MNRLPDTPWTGGIPSKPLVKFRFSPDILLISPKAPKRLLFLQAGRDCRPGGPGTRSVVSGPEGSVVSTSLRLPGELDDPRSGRYTIAVLAVESVGVEESDERPACPTAVPLIGAWRLRPAVGFARSRTTEQENRTPGRPSLGVFYFVSAELGNALYDAFQGRRQLDATAPEGRRTSDG